MKFRSFIFLGIIASLLGCSNTSTQFFEFDEVLHYALDGSNTKTRDIYDCNTPNRLENFGCEIVNGYRPYNLTDVLFIDSLKLLNYKIRTIDTTMFEALKQIFHETNPPFFNTANACEPIYRDILVFKYMGNISGIAKVCFECGKKHIVGSNSKTDGNFAFSRLKTVLKQER